MASAWAKITTTKFSSSLFKCPIPIWVYNISVIKELGIKKAKIYAYEFYEELAHEYQKPDSDNIKIEINEKTIQKLFDNYNMLNLVREFVKSNKK